jgi:hypothetical protein
MGEGGYSGPCTGPLFLPRLTEITGSYADHLPSYQLHEVPSSFMILATDLRMMPCATVEPWPFSPPDHVRVTHRVLSSQEARYVS